MPLSLQQLRDDLRIHLGVDDIELPNISADLLLNRSWWKVSDNYKFKEKEVTTTIPTIIGTDNYALPADIENIENVQIKDLNSLEWSPLTYRDETRFQADVTDNVSSRAIPEFYTNRGGRLTIQPAPDAVYSIRVHYVGRLADLVAAGAPIPQAWHEAILYGAIWRGFAQFGDYNRSSQAKATQYELLNTQEPVRERELKADTQHAGVQILRRVYR